MQPRLNIVISMKIMEWKGRRCEAWVKKSVKRYYTTDSVPQAKVRDLEQFMSQWFTNIHDQGFGTVEVRHYNEEEEEENEFEM